MFPSHLGPYRIVRKLGRGGMGTVYLGVDDALDQTAAVKLLAGDMAQQPDFRERFKSEIETLRKLNHPHIVQIFGFGEDDQQLFYAMEFVAGSSLEEQLSRGRVFSWREVTQFGVAVARALRHAHDRGIIHRDIKPGNLLLCEDGVLKLSDFGIARLFGSARLTGAGSVLGTAEFMAPEQAEGRPVDPRSDLYSLGAVMYVLLARRPLYVARSFVEMLEKQRLEKPAPLRQAAPDIPAELEHIVHRLLEKNPADRLSTATVLERRLETMQETFALPPEPRTVTIELVHGGGSPGADPPTVDPLARTVAATQAPVHPPEPVPFAAPPAGGGLANHADSGNEAPVSTEGPAVPAPRTAGRFVPVQPGELDRAAHDRPAASWISPQTGALVVGLVVLGLLAWHVLQPPTADALYRRIQRQTSGGSTESLEQAEDDIRQFLTRFSGDARSEELKDDIQRIELARLDRHLELQAKGVNVQSTLSPAERTYLDALNTARTDPESGMAKLQAMIDLFDSPGDGSRADVRCVELARRRLTELRKQYDVQSREQLTAVRERIRLADELRKTDPQRAAVIYRAVITLYANKAWAKDVVQQARARSAGFGRNPGEPAKAGTTNTALEK